MTNVKMPLLLIPSPPEPLDVHVHIPPPKNNLFERLIRDPQTPERPVRERHCAEMLCSVLIECIALRIQLLRWMAGLASVPVEIVDELTWQMETEQAIGSKRDDLRIEGFLQTEEGNDTPIVLWTVEIKVAAPLHESSRLDMGAETEPSLDEDPEIVSQLVNYNSWLATQDVRYKAGFVLALRDMSTALPKGLAQDWHCFTWTDLAMETEKALADDLVPMSERSLAEHMLGFIRHRLWDCTDMDVSRLELDDVTLLRALAAIGPSCSLKIKKLVQRFKELFEETEISFLTLGPTSSFFDRTDVAQYAMGAKCANDNSYLAVNAGVVADSVQVWIACSSTSRDSSAMRTAKEVRKLLQQHKAELIERNPAWIVTELDASNCVGVHIRKSLISVLTEDDWQTPCVDFVRQSLRDIKEVGILEALVAIPIDGETVGNLDRAYPATTTHPPTAANEV